MKSRIGFACVALALSSCRGLIPAHPTLGGSVEVFVESDGPDAVGMRLPESGVRIPVSPRPILRTSDFTRVQVAQLELGDGLLFVLTPAAARALADAVPRIESRRLVLVINGSPVGAQRMNRAGVGTLLSFFLEIPESDLTRLAAKLESGG